MIQKVEMYRAVCDRCGQRCVGCGRDVWINRSSAAIFAKQQDWKEIDALLYYPGCVEYDEETDSYKPKNNKQ